MLSKELSNIIVRNVRFNTSAPDEYILHQSKHIPQGDIALMNKFEKIKKFAEKHHGECRIENAPRIVGADIAMTFYMVCDCVAAKAFDALLAN